jgi:hypothetical protein
VRNAFQVDQCSAPPQPQRLTDHVRCPLRLAQGQQISASIHHPLETLRIHLVNWQSQPITLPGRSDRGRPQCLAQPDHAPLHDLGPRRRWHIGPQGIGQTLGAHHLTRTQGQRRQHHPIPRPDRNRAAIHADRTQHRDTHHSKCPPDPDTGQRR